MKHFIWALLFLGFSSNASTGNGGHTLETAPWSDEKYEVCPTPMENGLRAVIFKPEVEEWNYKVEYPETTKLVATENGISEIVVNNDQHLPAYYLKEQKIGYLDANGIWVDEHGVHVTRFNQLTATFGEKAQPKVQGSQEKQVYKANFEREHAAAMKKIYYEAPCTVFSVGHFDKLESELQYDFGSNNPYQCDAEIGLKRSQKFDYIRKVQRPVVAYTDGSNYYVKFPNGDIKTYRAYHPIWEVLYREDGSPICEWNDLGSLIGYELVNPTQ